MDGEVPGVVERAGSPGVLQYHNGVELVAECAA